MRKLLLAGLAGLLMAGPALAQRDFQDRRDDRREFREDRREFREDRRDFRDARRDFRDDRRDFRDDRRDYRGDVRRFDSRWNGPRYRGAYAYPRGLRYQAWGVGRQLPRAYYSNRYFIGDPGFYRLPPAYRGTRWVRVGPDALLIRIGNRGIVRAVRGIYY